MDIRQVVARRSDLSTFLVHLTRKSGDMRAKEVLKKILREGRLVAGSMFGPASTWLRDHDIELDSQKCVCFTETPLEYVHLLLENIPDRQVQPETYGVAFPKKLGRQKGINPIWYVDITPGHFWLTNPIGELIEQARARFDESPISRLTPFIEQMGTGQRAAGDRWYRKEFWWEREWRAVQGLSLPHRVIVLCPEAEFGEFRGLPLGLGLAEITLLDPYWGLEQIISRLAGYDADESDIL